MRIRTALLCAPLAALLMFAACGDDDASGTDTTAGDTTAGDTTTGADTTVAGDTAGDTAAGNACDDGLPVPVLGPQGHQNTQECLDCMAARCCDQMVTCRETAVCADLRDCFGACADDDEPCTSGCTVTHGSSTENGAVVTCRAVDCGFVCAANECVGSLVWSEPDVATYQVDFGFADFQSGTMLSGATIRVCAKDDPECANPLSEVTTGPTGWVTLDIPSAADGLAAFINVSAQGYMPTDLWYKAADPLEFTKGTTWNVVSEGTVALISAVLDVTLDPTRGGVAFLASDCQHLGTAGITVTADTADDDSLRFYLANGLPITTVTETQRGGFGAIVNLPPGPTLLTATGPNGEPWGSHTVNVRAGHLVGTNMPPTP